jgi:hypothetical protein
MKCTDCGSDNCQRLEVVYQGGTSNIETHSSGSAIGLARGGLGVGIGRSKTSGTSQTQLAARASPPKKKRYALWVIILIVGLVFVSQAKLEHLTMLMIGIVLMAGSLCMCYLAFQINDPAPRARGIRKCH